ncbi:hypothetical protein ABIB40_001370 [Pedobacter sp. UYP30]|uniref:hypothetical protein n=1 Tax=Pedobacter sp. UYP30 TaxID=1756400 RepID=UPI003395E234
MDNQSSFILMYKTYAAPLYGVILKWVGNGEAEKQILEDTFTQVWKNGASLLFLQLKPFSQLHLIAERFSKRHLVN